MPQVLILTALFDRLRGLVILGLSFGLRFLISSPPPKGGYVSQTHRNEDPYRLGSPSSG